MPAALRRRTRASRSSNTGSTPPLMERAGLAVAKLALALWPGAGSHLAGLRPGQQRQGRPRRSAGWLHGLPVHVSLSADGRPCRRRRAAHRAGAGRRRCSDPCRPSVLGRPCAHRRRADGPGPTATTNRRRRGQPTPKWPTLLPRVCACWPWTCQRSDGRHRHGVGRAPITRRPHLSLLTLKPGLFTGAGRAHAGQVWFDDLGVSTTASITGRRRAAGR